MQPVPLSLQPVQLNAKLAELRLQRGEVGAWGRRERDWSIWNGRALCLTSHVGNLGEKDLRFLTESSLDGVSLDATEHQL